MVLRRIKLKSQIRVRTIIPFCVENLFKEKIMRKAVSVFNIRSGGALFCVLALLSFTAFGTSNANSLVALEASNVEDGIRTIGNCTVIDKPGSYELAKGFTATGKDLKTSGSSNPSCILIVADYVSLDLHGYTIVGPGSGFGIYSTANTSGKYPIATHVRNGVVTNFERGIALEGSSHKAEKVRVVGNNHGLTLDGAGFAVQEVQALSNGNRGIHCFGGSGHSVRNSQVVQNGGTGIDLSECPGSSIIGTNVSGNGGGGIVAKCPSLILQNMAFQNVGGDIVAEPAAACTRSDNNPAP